MKKIIVLALLIGLTTACEDFEGWNTDPKRPSDVSGAYLFTSAQQTLAYRLTSPNVNSSIFKFFAQHWTATTYPDEANYDLVNRDVGGNFWSDLYRNVLADLAKSKEIISDDETIEATPKANQLAIADLMMVFTWHVLVDVYGDIPYSEALQGNENLVPAYDDDEAIYMDLFNRIDAAIATLSAGGSSFGGADLIYNGDTEKWVKFANSLKLRMAVRISDVNQSTASIKATEAFDGGVFESAADNAAFPFESTPPNTNAMWVDLVQSGRFDFIVSNTFVDVIVPLDDPRIPVFMQDNVMPYVGGPYGDNNSYANYTHIGEVFYEADLEGLLMSYSEVEFLLAEASARNLISSDAEDHYNMAITASLEYWGVGGQASSYLGQSNVAYDAGNWKKSIGVQKWISLFTRGFEAWASWKLLDYPAMNTAAISALPVPRRYIYPNSEPNVNEENYDAAVAAMGGDELTSRVFWDELGQGN